MEKNQKKITGYPHIDRPWSKFYPEGAIDRSVDYKNITTYLKEKTASYGDLNAYEYYKNSETYGQFWNSVDQASVALSQFGIKKGDRVINLMANTPETGKIFLGASQIGATSDYIDPRPDGMDMEANAKKTLDLIEAENAKHIITLDKCYMAMLQPIESELRDRGIERIITTSAADSMTIIGIIDYLIDVARYNQINNNKAALDATIKKIRTYKALLNKIQEMKTDKEKFEELKRKSKIEIVSYSDLLKDCKGTSGFELERNPEMINYIGHTSGTSGARPKPITLSSKNEMSAIEQLFSINANFKPNDRILHELPYFAPMGMVNNYLLNIASGSNNIEIPEFDISEFAYLVKKYRPNVVLGTPSWIVSLTNSDYLKNMNLSCITRVIYGGDSMTASDEEKVNLFLKQHGSKAEVEKGHGMSEYCGCGSYAQGKYNMPDSMGIPLPSTIYGIVDPSVDEKLVPVKFKEGEKFASGELVVSSDAVTNGKLDGKIIVPRYEMDGKEYIRTRDIVKMSRDGIFYFDSRKDRSFSRFDGYKFKPHEVESIIEQNENVLYCRIVPYYDKNQKGLMPKAHIVLKPELQESEDYENIVRSIIDNQIIPNLSSRQMPSKFKFRNKLPLTKNSKVDFNFLISEGLDGSEISVNVNETNLSIDNIEIVAPTKQNVLLLNR